MKILKPWGFFLMISSLMTTILSAQELASKPTNSQPASQFAERNPRYRLRIIDELEIRFRLTPRWDQTVSVQPDGFVSLLDVGDLKVVGLTLDEVRQEVVRSYSKLLKDPLVTVKLVNMAKPYFVVGGEVVNPGRYDFLGEHTISDGIAIAGGFTVGARSTEVLLFRRFSRTTVEVKKIDVKTVLRGQPEEDVFLVPGDAVFVPRSKIGKIDRFLKVSRVTSLLRIPLY